MRRVSSASTFPQKILCRARAVLQSRIVEFARAQHSVQRLRGRQKQCVSGSLVAPCRTELCGRSADSQKKAWKFRSRHWVLGFWEGRHNSNATQPASAAGCSRASRVAWPTTRLSSLRPISFRREGMGLSWQGRGTESEGLIPEREPEKRLSHPRKAAGAQSTQTRQRKVVRRINGFGDLALIFEIWVLRFDFGDLVLVFEIWFWRFGFDF